MRLCRKCGARPVPPSHMQSGNYVCSACRNGTPAAKARLTRYRKSDKRKMVVRRVNDRRVWVGRDYYGHAPSAEAARAINAHVRRRRRDFHGRTECHSVETVVPRRS